MKTVMKTLGRGKPKNAASYKGFCNICPQFTVSDWGEAEPIMAEFVKATKTEEGCVYYGWTRKGDQLVCREAYVNGEAVLKHLENVGDYITELLTVAELNEVSIDCPRDQIEVVRPKTEALGTKYFEIVEGGFTNVKSLKKKSDIPSAKKYKFCSIYPTFTVHDWDRAEPLMEEFCKKTKRESGNKDGCIYYGWTKSGDKLKCREAYADGNAVNAHIENVGDLIEKMINTPADNPIAKLDGIQFHGPADELAIVKAEQEALNAEYFVIHSGFSYQI